jgi:hypothetical protein
MKDMVALTLVHIKFSIWVIMSAKLLDISVVSANSILNISNIRNIARDEKKKEKKR